MININRIVLFIVFFTSICLSKPLIYLVSHQDIPAYNIAMDAIKKNLSSDFELKLVTINRQTLTDVTKAIKKDKPKLTISVGTKATKLLQIKLKREPILFTMVFRPDRTELVKKFKISW